MLRVEVLLLRYRPLPFCALILLLGQHSKQCKHQCCVEMCRPCCVLLSSNTHTQVCGKLAGRHT